MSNTKERFDALTTSAGRVARLREDLSRVQDEHEQRLREFLDAVAGEADQFSFGVKERDQVIAEGPLNEEARAMFAAFASTLARAAPGGGAGCPEKTNCANIGQLGNKCFYICKTVAFNPK